MNINDPLGCFLRFSLDTAFCSSLVSMTLSSALGELSRRLKNKSSLEHVADVLASGYPTSQECATIRRELEEGVKDNAVPSQEQLTEAANLAGLANCDDNVQWPGEESSSDEESD